MPVAKNKSRGDGARRTTMSNFPNNPEIPEMSSMRVSDVPYDYLPTPHEPEPEYDMSRCILLHE